MDIKFLLNNKLEVMVGDSAFKRTIQDSTENYIAITIPVKDGQYYVPQKGDKLEALYFEDNNVYKFESFVTGRRAENNIPQIVIAFPQKVVKVQRRQFVRVSVAYYIQYETVNLDGVEAMPDKQPARKGIMLDISGGGFRLKIKEPLRLGDRLIAEIPTEATQMQVKGRVVRVERDPEGSFICGISFIEMDTAAQEKIIRYIFTIMRKQRKTL